MEERTSDQRSWVMNTRVNDWAPRSCAREHWFLSIDHRLTGDMIFRDSVPVSSVDIGTLASELWQSELSDKFVPLGIPVGKRLEFSECIMRLGALEIEVRGGVGRFTVEAEVVHYDATNEAPLDVDGWGVEPAGTESDSGLDEPGLEPASDKSISRLLKNAREKDAMADPDACPICIEDFANDHTLVDMPCKHVFCVPCIVQWLEKNGTCPICRYKLED